MQLHQKSNTEVSHPKPASCLDNSFTNLTGDALFKISLHPLQIGCYTRTSTQEAHRHTQGI